MIILNLIILRLINKIIYIVKSDFFNACGAMLLPTSYEEQKNLLVKSLKFVILQLMKFSENANILARYKFTLVNTMNIYRTKMNLFLANVLCTSYIIDN